MKNHSLAFLIVCTLLLFFNFNSVQSADLDEYRWTNIDATGDVTGRHENVFVEYKDKFYLMGGRGINPVNVFDPETNSWETKGKSPIEIHHFQAIVNEDAIYMVGAMTGGYPTEVPLENIWIYYPETDAWEKGPVIPESRRRGGAGSVIYNNKIYMVCGIEFGHTSGTNNYFDSYDLLTGEWEILTKAPHVRDHFPAIVVDDRLYCVGGRNTSVHTTDNFGAFFMATVPYVDVYDFKEEKWYILQEEIPWPTAAGGLVHIDNKLIYMGGEGAFKQAYNQTQCLDLETGKWSQLAPLYRGRHGSSAILYNNNIYIAAGSPVRGGGNLTSIEVFSAEHDWERIFNGKSLDGWEVKCTEPDKDKQYWTFDNGAILSNTLGHNDHDYIWLQTQSEYSDFELRLKFQATRKNKGNSGVQVRSRYDETYKLDEQTRYPGWLDGPQIDINPNAPFRNGYIYDETRKIQRWIHPSLPDWNISEEEYTPKNVIYYWDDEGPGWNDMTFICKGMHIVTYVNNIKISDYDGTGILDDKDHKKLQVGSAGYIALQLHKNDENYIRFKDIEIRKLQE